MHVRKVKLLKAPRFDLGRLLELHGDGDVAVDVGKTVVGHKEYKEPEVLASV